MFKHLLLPTDGSQLSKAAVQKSVQFAKSINAKVTGLYVMPVFHAVGRKTEMLDDADEAFARECRALADQFLSVIEDAAKATDVACETELVISDHPYEAIIKAAEEKGCDVIAMASHGRKGVQGLTLGSETQKVLTNSKIPVLVFR
jgi:nucleotide-binding universal stress UspA family protein